MALLRLLPLVLLWAASATQIHPLSHLPEAAVAEAHGHVHVLETDGPHAADLLCLDCIAASAARAALPSPVLHVRLGAVALPQTPGATPAPPGPQAPPPRSRSPPLA
jgi:hypothetical protein